MFDSVKSIISDYIEVWGFVFTALGGLILASKEPWSRKIFRGKLVAGRVGMVIMTGGLIISAFATIVTIRANTEMMSRIVTIDKTGKKTLDTLEVGFATVLNDFERNSKAIIKEYSSNFQAMMDTVRSNSDSALTYQLNKIRDDYTDINDTLTYQKDITNRYYSQTQWPFSEKDKSIRDAMFGFVSGGREFGLLDGVDRYIIWRLMQNDGAMPYDSIGYLQKEIWSQLRPIEISIGNNIAKLELLEIIKPDYMPGGKIEFTEYYMKKLAVFMQFGGTEEYERRIMDLQHEKFLIDARKRAEPYLQEMEKLSKEIEKIKNEMEK